MNKNSWILSLLFALSFMVSPLMAMPITVNINNADAETLTKQLKGIGPSRAAAIVEYREKNGPFAEIEDIVLVKGIGWKTMEANRESIRLRDDDSELTGQSGKDKESSAKSAEAMAPDTD